MRSSSSSIWSHTRTGSPPCRTIHRTKVLAPKSHNSNWLPVQIINWIYRSHRILLSHQIFRSWMPWIRTHHSWRHAQHHEEIRDGKIDDEQVARSAKTLGGGEYIYHHAVTNDRYCAKDADGETKKSMPQRIHRRELVPVNIDHVKHLRWHFVDHCLITKSASLCCPRVSCMTWSGYERHGELRKSLD